MPFDKNGLFTDNNEIGTPSVKSENKNTPKIVESTHCYPLRKINPPTYLANCVTKSESEDLVNHVNFCYVLNVPNSFEEALERDDNLKCQYAMKEEIKSLETNNRAVGSSPKCIRTKLTMRIQKNLKNTIWYSCYQSSKTRKYNTFLVSFVIPLSWP